MIQVVRTPGRLTSAALPLPSPRLNHEFRLSQALAERRSVREYRPGALTLAQAAQLLWAAQGITHENGARTAPSAGALYPLELYLVVGEVDGLAAGIYQYRPAGHELQPVKPGDARCALYAAALAQDCVLAAAAVFAFTAIEERSVRKYGTRAARYIEIEVGHAAQNLSLAATALGLGAATVGAFEDAAVARLLDLPRGEAPLYLVPVGRL